MKFLTLLAFLIFASTSYGAKISELNSLNNAQMANDDVMVVVDTDATETKKITISELSLRWLTSTITSATVTTGLTFDNEAYAEFQEATGNGDNYIRIKAPATLAGDYVLTLPVDDGDSGECLTTNGSGVLSWDTCGGGGGLADVTGSDLLDGRIWIGDGSNEAVELAVSGDIGLSNAGVASISTGVIVNADINASAAIDASKIADGSVSSTEFQYLDGLSQDISTSLSAKLEDVTGSSLLDGRFWIGNVSNQAAELAISGDIGISNAGVASISSGVIVNADINASAGINATKIADGSVSSTEFQYLDGLSEDIATTLDAKVDVAGDSMTGNLNLEAQSDLRLEDSSGGEYVALQAPSSVTTYTLTLPDDAGTNGFVLSTNGSGVTSWVSNSGGSGLATTGGTMTGDITMDNETGILFSENDSNGSNTAEIKAPASLGASYVLTLPPDDGDANQVLSTNGSGTLDWVDQSGGGGGGFSGGDFFDEYNAQSSNYTVLDTDFFLAGDSSGGSFTFTLPAGSTGQRLIFKKTDSSFNKIDIGSITDLDTEGESATLVYTGSAWIVENKYIPSEWVTFTPGTNWSGAEGAWKRIGDSVVVKWSLDLTGTPSGNINIDIPSGLTMDSSVMLQENNFIANNWGWCTMQRAQNHIAFLAWIDSNTFMLRYQAVSGTDVISSNTSPSGPATWGTGDHIWCTSQPLPISEWRD